MAWNAFQIFFRPISACVYLRNPSECKDVIANRNGMCYRGGSLRIGLQTETTVRTNPKLMSNVGCSIYHTFQCDVWKMAVMPTRSSMGIFLKDSKLFVEFSASHDHVTVKSTA